MMRHFVHRHSARKRSRRVGGGLHRLGHDALGKVDSATSALRGVPWESRRVERVGRCDLLERVKRCEIEIN